MNPLQSFDTSLLDGADQIVLGQQDQQEVELVSDVMREINHFLTERDDTLALSQVNEAWRHALKDNTSAIWKQEWETFERENRDEKWFTRTVYTVPFKDSKFSDLINSARKHFGKDEKEHQSFRQRMAGIKLEKVETPSHLELLITNGQRKMAAMSKEELAEIMKDRPKARVVLAKIGCIVAAPVLGVIGLIGMPLTAIGVGSFLALSKGKRGGGGPTGAGAGVALVMLFGFPTVIPWMGAYYSLEFVVSRDNLRNIPQLYKSLKEHYEKYKQQKTTK